MLSCDSFRDRLYDEDARRALAGEAPAPADLQAHRLSCADCRREWDEAASDLAALPRLMLERPPSALERRLRIGAAERLAPSPSFDWMDAATWAAVGAVGGIVAAGYLSWIPGVGPATLGTMTAALAFAAHAGRVIGSPSL
jgi:hypothetical protein